MNTKNSHLFSCSDCKKFWIIAKKCCTLSPSPSDVATYSLCCVCVCTQMFIYKIILVLSVETRCMLLLLRKTYSEMIQHVRSGLHGDICLKSCWWCAFTKQNLLHKFNGLVLLKISAINLCAHVSLLAKTTSNHHRH